MNGVHIQQSTASTAQKASAGLPRKSIGPVPNSPLEMALSTPKVGS